MTTRIINDELAAQSREIYTNGTFSVSFARLMPADNLQPAIDAIYLENTASGSKESLYFQCAQKDLVEATTTEGGRVLSSKRFGGTGEQATQYVQKTVNEGMRYSREQFFDRNGELTKTSISKNTPSGHEFAQFIDEKDVMTRVEDILLKSKDQKAPSALQAQKEMALEYINRNKAKEFPQPVKTPKIK